MMKELLNIMNVVLWTQLGMLAKLLKIWIY